MNHLNQTEMQNNESHGDKIKNGLNITVCKNNLANNLRHLRKNSKLSQEKLAHLIGLNRGNIASYEKRSAEPNIYNLLKISYFFKVPIIDLIEKDLREEKTLNSAKNNFQNKKSVAREIFNNFHNKLSELKDVFSALQKYHTFKTDSISEMPKDMLLLTSNYEKLSEITNHIIQSHENLIEMIRKYH